MYLHVDVVITNFSAAIVITLYITVKWNLQGRKSIFFIFICFMLKTGSLTVLLRFYKQEFICDVGICFILPHSAFCCAAQKQAICCGKRMQHVDGQ